MVLSRLLATVCLLFLTGSLSAQTGQPAATTPPTTQAPIRNVVFRNARLLSPHDRRKISKALRDEEIVGAHFKEDLGAPDAALRVAGVADEAAERVRAAYQDQGYFNVQVTAKAVPTAKGAAARYDIVIQVLEEGKQYRLGDLRIIHMTVFSEQELRNVFPIQRGEIFSREVIAKGLDELRRLYGSQGYINFISVPNTSFDEEHSSASLEIDVDEGQPFHWGDLYTVGMRDQDEQLLLQAWSGVRGQPYVHDDGTLQKFFGKFFRPLSKGTAMSDYTVVKVDYKTGTVDVYLNLTWNPDLLRSVGSKQRPAH